MQAYLINLNELQNLGGVPNILKLEAAGQNIKGAHGGSGCQTSSMTGQTVCAKKKPTTTTQQFGIGTQQFGGSGGSPSPSPDPWGAPTQGQQYQKPSAPAKKPSEPAACHTNVGVVAGGTPVRNSKGCITGYVVGLNMLL